MSNIPSDVFCSNAYYTFPNMPMSEKEWKEADIIFAGAPFILAALLMLLSTILTFYALKKKTS